MKHFHESGYMPRRTFLQVFTTATTSALFSRSGVAANVLPTVVAYRNPGCGCCEKWTGHMKTAGFEIVMEDDADLATRKTKLGVPEKLAGCHTALIGNYVIEGHVPPDDIIRFLAEKPDALGLAVAGMPIGSPGMEMGESREPFDVIMFKADGSSESYAKHS
jgi:hypothetical protein